MKLPRDVATPLEWHPYYRNKTHLLDWIEGRATGYDSDSIRIPIISRRIYFSPEIEMETANYMPDLKVITMTRHKAIAPAPYVGRPFCYVWYVGVDNLGRQIAGDCKIVYMDGLP